MTATLETLAGNTSINAQLHFEILPSFGDRSRSRMVKKLRGIMDLAEDNREESNRQGLHTFREILVGHAMNQHGCDLEYDAKVDGRTPDWYDSANKLLVEVFTCDAGGTSDPERRIGDTIEKKVSRYGPIVMNRGLEFAVAVHPSFLLLSVSDDDDWDRVLSRFDVFARFPEISGVLFFAETQWDWVTQPDGTKWRKQFYRFSYLENRSAAPR